MNEDDEKKYYYEELDFIRELENRNDVSRDTTLIQLSVGLFALLATFGEKIIKANITLSYIAFGCLTFTILVLIIGFATTSRMLQTIREKMQKNIQDGKSFYIDYAETPWQGVNTFINISAFILFILSILSVSALLLIYIGSLNV